MNQVRHKKEKADSKLLLRLFLVMMKIGALTFGGGLAMLAQMQHELVDRQHWVEKDELIDLFALSQSMPGVIAVNSAYAVGYKVAGVSGALVAALGAILPSFLVLVVVTLLYEQFITNSVIAGAMRGIRCAVTALLLSTVCKLRATSAVNVFGWVLCVAATALALLTNVNVIYLILGGALLGLLRYAVLARRSGGDA